MSLLEVEGLQARYGLLQAVRGVTFGIGDGERVALVGANGAGKTTLLRVIAGAHRAAGGSVRFDGADVTSMPAHLRVRQGIALVPEGRRLFPDLTVAENLQVAGARTRSGPWDLGTVMAAFPMLARLRDQRASTLSGGQQQATAIARALMTNPRLLLLDEVSLGLAPAAVDAVYASLQSLAGTQTASSDTATTDTASSDTASARTTVVLVEQDLTRAMRFADRVLCLLEGRVVLEGRSAELTREQVTEAFFGLGHGGSGPAQESA